MTNKLLRATVLNLCLASMAMTAAAQSSPTLKKIADNGTIGLGHRESSIPFSYYDDKQQVVGYSHELMLKVVEAIKADLKKPSLAIKLVPVTSQNRIPLVLNGTVDLECGSTTNNKERAKQVDFSTTIFIVGTRLMTRKDSGIKDFADLKGKNVVVTAGTTSERLLRKFNEVSKSGMSIISAKDHGESFLTLETGRAAAFMLDDALLYGEKAKAKKADDWAVVGKPMSFEPYGCMMRKGDPVFQKLVDDALTKAMISGEAAKIYAKWFQQPIPPKGLNLNWPLSETNAALFKAPNDKTMD
ncbi:MAG: glutamate/aspartate ABC transporter substrate-binding protein [Aquabacterium sp.]|uniref:glutamate/aspartate ABC transporter substrate-binding protein n=1 Tax=Aquabacterium sp. TaxID=1872578 RepID=UPI002720D623|nr:glutamate/aspartate ABC transporter substrate-binding protein [Aquabacterium sp.]MDO9006208.1 glutamate/aspartate ABC transporter substrate-binding protein [Aquabacterium sp.]